MKYTEPVIDRALSDVISKTSKGYFNVSDWTRIYENNLVVNALLLVVLEEVVTFTSIDTPTITTIPTITMVNNLVGNIEASRLKAIEFVEGASASDERTNIMNLIAIKTNWEAGARKDAPDYLVANQWEETLHVIFNNIGDAVGYTSWVSDAVSPTRKPRTGPAVSGTGLMRQNGFRRYS